MPVPLMKAGLVAGRLEEGKQNYQLRINSKINSNDLICGFKTNFVILIWSSDERFY
jgi:hypothetical protein